MTQPDDLLEQLLRPQEPLAELDVRKWLADLPQELLAAPPFHRAVLSARATEQPHLAQAAAHQAALRRLLPALEPEPVYAFCATEPAGNHPASITTRLDLEAPEGPRLDGVKRWATLAPLADRLLVIASIGERDGRNQLRLVDIDAGAEGVEIEALQLPFETQLPHAEIQLRGVRVAPERCSGEDAYLTALKPFRTLEDLYLTAARVAGFVVLGSRFGWPKTALEESSAILAALEQIESRDPLRPTTHLRLAGASRQTDTLFRRWRHLWLGLDPAVAGPWHRLLLAPAVAAIAKRARTQAAWQMLRGPQPELPAASRAS